VPRNSTPKHHTCQTSGRVPSRNLSPCRKLWASNQDPAIRVGMVRLPSLQDSPPYPTASPTSRAGLRLSGPAAVTLLRFQLQRLHPHDESGLAREGC
jgi:hypothetical protein